MPTLYFLCGSLGCALLSSRWGELALITDCFLLPLSRLITASPYLCGDLIEATRFRESVTGGAEKKKPTARFASGGGLETFSSLLAVSPRAGSENNLLSRSRGNRHGRLGRNSLSGDGYHCERKNSTSKDGSEEKFVGWKRKCLKQAIWPFLRFFLSAREGSGWKHLFGRKTPISGRWDFMAV